VSFAVLAPGGQSRNFWIHPHVDAAVPSEEYQVFDIDYWLIFGGAYDPYFSSETSVCVVRLIGTIN
jgi:hypothetical protein